MPGVSIKDVEVKSIFISITFVYFFEKSIKIHKVIYGIRIIIFEQFGIVLVPAQNKMQPTVLRSFIIAQCVTDKDHIFRLISVLIEYASR